MIPKVIYMCHKSIDKIKEYSKKWIVLNPEYRIQLYDDEKCRNFLLNNYCKTYANIFDYIKEGPIKADFWRICILNKYGGLYADADINPLVPLKKYIEDDDDFATCISANYKKNNLEWQLNPHFLLSHKNNPILKSCINKYISYYNNKEPYSYWGWSICRLMVIEGIFEKKSQVLIIGGKKCKFLCEKDYDNCEYNGEIVLYNRYSNYRNHDFIEFKVEIPIVICLMFLVIFVVFFAKF